MRKPAGWGSVINVQLDGEGLLASERSLKGWIRLPAASLCRCWEESGWEASRLGPAVTQRRGVSAGHEAFDVVGFDGNVGHEVDDAVVGDEDVVLETDGHVFGGDVDGGFDGHDPAGGEGF